MSQHYHSTHQTWETHSIGDSDGNRTECTIRMSLSGVPTVVGSGVARRTSGDARNQWLGEQLATIRAHRELLLSLGRMLIMREPHYIRFAGFTDEEVKEMLRQVSEYQANVRALTDASVASVMQSMGIPQGTPEGELAWAESQEKDDGV